MVLAGMSLTRMLLFWLQRPLNTRDPVSLAGRDTNYRNTPISWKGPKHEKCIVDKVMVTSECCLLGCCVGLLHPCPLHAHVGKAKLEPLSS